VTKVCWIGPKHSAVNHLLVMWLRPQCHAAFMSSGSYCNYQFLTCKLRADITVVIMKHKIIIIIIIIIIIMLVSEKQTWTEVHRWIDQIWSVLLQPSDDVNLSITYDEHMNTSSAFKKRQISDSLCPKSILHIVHRIYTNNTMWFYTNRKWCNQAVTSGCYRRLKATKRQKSLQFTDVFLFQQLYSLNTDCYWWLTVTFISVTKSSIISENGVLTVELLQN